MIVVLHVIVLCRFAVRSYATNVIPVSYAWSTFTGPVSGEVQEVKPWKPSSSSSFTEFESSNDESNSYGPDYVAKPHYSFAYGVEDGNTGNSHGHSEKREGSVVTGEYSVTEPDGTLRRVLYTADPENGFRASVRYVRPDESETAHDNDYNHGHDHDNHLHHQHRSPSPVSQNEFEYESNDPTYLTPPRPSSYFSDFDASQRYNDGVGDEYEDDGATPFKFPPSPRPLFKTADTDSDNFGGIGSKNHYSGAFGPSSPPSPLFASSSPAPYESPSPRPSPYGSPLRPSPFRSPTSPPFGSPTSPPFGSSTSPPFGSPASSPSPFGRAVRPPQPPLPCAPLTRAPTTRSSSLSTDAIRYQLSNEFRKPSADDDDSEPFRSLTDFDDGDNDDHEDIEDDTDMDTTDDAEPSSPPTSSDSVRRPLPSRSARQRPSSASPLSASQRPLSASQRPSSAPPSSSSTPLPTVTSRGLTATALSSSSSSPQPHQPQFQRLSADLSPSPTMTPIEPIIIDIDR